MMIFTPSRVTSRVASEAAAVGSTASPVTKTSFLPITPPKRSLMRSRMISNPSRWRLPSRGEVAGQRLQHPDLVLSAELLPLDGADAERHRDEAQQQHHPLHVSHADSPLVDREMLRLERASGAATRLTGTGTDSNRSVPSPPAPCTLSPPARWAPVDSSWFSTSPWPPGFSTRRCSIPPSTAASSPSSTRCTAPLTAADVRNLTAPITGSGRSRSWVEHSPGPTLSSHARVQAAMANRIRAVAGKELHRHCPELGLVEASQERIHARRRWRSGSRPGTHRTQ